jgi:hypothetical protein
MMVDAERWVLLILALDRAAMARALITAVVIMWAMATPAVITDGHPEPMSRFATRWDLTFREWRPCQSMAA